MRLWVVTIILLLLVSGCEPLKPNSIRVGFSPPYYEDTPMWRGFHIGASWDL